jgi:hypothetical protein
MAESTAPLSNDVNARTSRSLSRLQGARSAIGGPEVQRFAAGDRASFPPDEVRLCETISEEVPMTSGQGHPLGRRIGRAYVERSAMDSKLESDAYGILRRSDSRKTRSARRERLLGCSTFATSWRIQ